MNNDDNSNPNVAGVSRRATLTLAAGEPAADSALAEAQRLALGGGFLIGPAPPIAVQEELRDSLPHIARQRHLGIGVVNHEGAGLHFAAFFVFIKG